MEAGRLNSSGRLTPQVSKRAAGAPSPGLGHVLLQPCLPLHLGAQKVTREAQGQACAFSERQSGGCISPGFSFRFGGGGTLHEVPIEGGRQGLPGKQTTRSGSKPSQGLPGRGGQGAWGRNKGGWGCPPPGARGGFWAGGMRRHGLLAASPPFFVSHQCKCYREVSSNILLK